MDLVRLSPDGRSILGVRSAKSGRGDVLTLVVEPAPGGTPSWTKLRPSGLGNLAAEWVPNGKALSYALNQGAVGNIWLQPLDQGPPRQITRFDDLRVYAHAWSPDGRTLYVVRGRNVSDAVLIRDFR